MNILFTRFPLESTYGGAEVQTLSLMKGLRERGYEVAFLGSCQVLLQKTASEQLTATKLDIGPPPVTKWGVVSFLWRQSAIRKKIIESLRPPHPALSPMGEGNVICMLSLTEKLLLTDWAVRQGIRVFWIEHDRIGRWLRWNPWLPRLRRLSRLATTVVVSDLSKRMYVELGFFPKRIVVIPNGIDSTHLLSTKGSTISPHPNPLPPGEGNRSPFHIGCIARLSHEKGVDLLIEAVKDLPNVHLTIVGTGRDEDRIRRRIDSLNPTGRQARQGIEEPNLPAGKAGNSITLLPSVPDVAAFYRSLDLFVLPSRDHDPCPLAPIEAMACGVPTILTDACGTAEYVENGKEAIVVPAGSSGALREAIFKIQNDRNFRHHLSTRGPQIVAERFSMERMMEQYEKLLMKI